MAEPPRGGSRLVGLVAVAACLMVSSVGAAGAAGAAESPSMDESEAMTDVEPDQLQPVGSVGDEWTLTWSDEFEGAAGSLPDPATWGYDLGDGSAIGLAGWGNNELEWYTDDPQNVALDGDGHLVITVREADGSLECYYGPCQYTSARLLTRDRFEFQHGYLEARLQVPAGFGLWPAFWLLGTDLDEVGWPQSGEIDVMEYVGRRPNEVFGTLHGPGYSGSGGISAGTDLGAPMADAFHTVALEWEPGRMAWFVDGERYHEVTQDQVAPNEWVFEQPFFMLLNVAVGGNLGGPVFPDNEFPARMVVDHVLLYEREPA